MNPNPILFQPLPRKEQEPGVVGGIGKKLLTAVAAQRGVVGCAWEMDAGLAGHAIKDRLIFLFIKPAPLIRAQNK
ncbi:MAG: hypothetical protein JXB25_00085 [Deltaproteobacteria bacterium]|nr:hypothetical protein [Deltaproteobacteria bacterium]